MTLLTSLLSASSTSVRAVPAYTEIGGPIISDTTWTLMNSPYIVTTNVQVTAGVTLTVEAGVVVKFNQDTLLQVDGTLIARGTAGNPITFTSNQASPAKGDWKNITFTDSSVDATFDAAGNYTGGSILEYSVVEYGGNGVGGAVQADKASPLIDRCTVRNNGSSGVHAGIQTVTPVAPPIVIRDNIIRDNSGGGIYASYATVTGNTVNGNSAGNGGGIFAFSSTVAGNTVSGNSAEHTSVLYGHGGGIYASFSTVTGNTVSGNSATNLGGGIWAGGSTVTGNTISGNSATNLGGGIYTPYIGTVTNNTVSGNSARSGGGIHAYGSTITGNTVSGNSATESGGGIWAEDSTVAGNIVGRNSAANNGGGIWADSIRATSNVASNIVSGNSAANSGGGIFALACSVISNTITANSLSTASDQGSGVHFSGWGDFLYNTIVGNTTTSPTVVSGGAAISGAPQFQHNNIYGNTNYDVVVLASWGDISSTHNYWGTVATADIQAHIYDWHDDSVRGELLYFPYLQDPDPNAQVPPPQNLRADFTGGSTRISWDAIPSTATGYGYKVYYDTDRSGPPYQGAGAAEGDSPIDVGNATHFTLSGLGSGGIYISVTAYDTQGRESWYSNEAVNLWRAYLPAVWKK